MKIKKIQIVRPEIEIEYCKPFWGRIYLAFTYPRFVKVVKMKCNINIASKLMENAGNVCIKRIWCICIPKIKVVDRI